MRRARILEQYYAKVDRIFTGRTFDVIKEIRLPEGQVYQTVLGHKGRHGWIIQDRETGEQFVAGWGLMKLIHDRFMGVTLPRRTAQKRRFDLS